MTIVNIVIPNTVYAQNAKYNKNGDYYASSELAATVEKMRFDTTTNRMTG